MTGWIIFGSILLVLILALVQSVTVTAVYDRNPELRIKILCFTIVKVPQDEKAKRKKAARERKKAEKERKKAEKERRKAEKLAAKEAKKNGITEVTSAAEPESPESPESPEEPGNTDNTEKAETAGAKPGKAKKEKPPKKKFKMPDIDLDMIRDYIASASPPIKRLFRKIRIRDVYIDWVVGSDDAAVTALKYGGVCAALYPAFEWIDTYFDAKIREVNIEADFSAEKDDIFAYGSLKLRISTAIGCALWLAVRMLKTYHRYNPPAGSKPKAGKRPKTKTRPVRVKAR